MDFDKLAFELIEIATAKGEGADEGHSSFNVKSGFTIGSSRNSKSALKRSKDSIQHQGSTTSSERHIRFSEFEIHKGADKTLPNGWIGAPAARNDCSDSARLSAEGSPQKQRSGSPQQQHRVSSLEVAAAVVPSSRSRSLLSHDSHSSHGPRMSDRRSEQPGGVQRVALPVLSSLRAPAPVPVPDVIPEESEESRERFDSAASSCFVGAETQPLTSSTGMLLRPRGLSPERLQVGNMEGAISISPRKTNWPLGTERRATNQQPPTSFTLSKASASPRPPPSMSIEFLLPDGNKELIVLKSHPLGIEFDEKCSSLIVKRAKYMGHAGKLGVRERWEVVSINGQDLTDRGFEEGFALLSAGCRRLPFMEE